MKNPTPLCKLAYKYGTDKCPQLKHPYTPFYYELLKDKQKSIKKVLEIGVGYSLTMLHMVKAKGYYLPGASLYMWRDFFSNAHIYGADIAPEALVSDKRITTFLCDVRYKENIEDLVRQVGTDIDLFIDDASHDYRDQIYLAQTILPLLKENVIYIIEDVLFPQQVVEALYQYECFIPDLGKQYEDEKLILVKNKV